MAVVPTTDTFGPQAVAQDVGQGLTLSESNLNISIPYVDEHYGAADGIIDPKEYAYNYTDPATGITVFLEHNSSLLYVGLSASTSGWIGIGWQNQTGGFTNAGLNGSDLILGYAPGTPHADVLRVTGSEPVTVHYELYLRNGTLIQEGDVPDDLSTTPLNDERLLDAYKEAIIGMRVGEIRHFIIPAEEAYNTPGAQLYGYDLEYVITLTRIGNDFSNPTDASEIVFSDRYGTSTFQHIADANQSQIIAADASDDGSTTQIEYFVQLNSTDPFDIPFLNNTDVHYPMVLMFSNSEDFGDLPVQHTDWSNPLMAELIPNIAPIIIVESPEQDAELGFVTNIELNITDNSFIQRAWYKFDHENWTEIYYSFQTGFWETSLDLSDQETGPHTLWFNATDPSNVTSLVYINVTINRPFLPLLGMKLDVDRRIYTRLYHSTEVIDQYAIRNNGSAPIGAIEVFLPDEWSGYFLSFIATDSLENEIRVERLPDYNGMMHWRLHFYEPIGFQETYRFETSMYLHSLHTLTNFDNNEYELFFLVYPVLPYIMTTFSFGIEFRSGDSMTGYLPETETVNIAPIIIEDFSTTIKSYTPFLVANRVTKITVDAWGWMSYEETIALENVGPARDNSISFYAPAYSSGIKVYDEVGVLATSVPNPEQPFNETAKIPINLRTDRFGEEGFWPGYKYTFHISYIVQLSGHTNPSANYEILDVPIGTIGDILVQTHEIDIVTPLSIAIISASGDYRLLYGIFDVTLQYKSYNSTEQNPAQISLTYQVSVNAAARPLAFSLIIGLISAIYVLARKVDLPVDGASARDGESAIYEQKHVGAPLELLREFATLYSRKTALGMDLEKLQAQLRRGKVKKREFLIRERDLKKQLADVDAQLPALKDELMSHGSRYRDMVAQLELQVEKIEGAKAGLRQLLLRKKKQRISRVAFERTREDYLKTIKRATSETDKILLSIQEEAGDI